MAPQGAKDPDLESVRAALALADSAPPLAEAAPFEARLAKTRTADTGKRMARPSLVASITSCSSLHTPTPINRSPASSPSNFMAILPF